MKITCENCVENEISMQVLFLAFSAAAAAAFKRRVRSYTHKHMHRHTYTLGTLGIPVHTLTHTSQIHFLTALSPSEQFV